MANDELLRLVAVGDVQPCRDDPETLFRLVADDLAWGDLRICQLECTMSDRGVVRTDVRNPAHRVSPSQLAALTAARFNVVSFAGNNNLDYGVEAFLDTLSRLRENGIAVVGAGSNLDEARKPLYAKHGNTSVAFVNFCSILRDGYRATPHRAGISPLAVHTYYQPLENILEQPGTPARTITVVDPSDLREAMNIIKLAKLQADVVVACFHWGVHFTHDLAQYQPDVAYAAIDAGADLVLGTHPHCLQGIDVYRGKFIFYSLGNFAFEQDGSMARPGVAEYLSFYGLPVEPDLPQHPHPRHCRLTMIAKVEIRGGSVAEVRLVPVYFNDHAQPEALNPSHPMRKSVVDLITELSDELGTSLSDDGRELKVNSVKAREVDVRGAIEKRKLSYPWLQRLVARQQDLARA